jgi:choline dehydrogenase-like flavoprotein
MITQPSSSFPDEDLPAGCVVDGLEPLSKDDQRQPHDFDVIVIGSGAAGGVAAHVFASAGLDVAICEEGPWIKTREVKEDCHSMFSRAMRLRGMQVLQGRAFMPMLQGRCVGGSTLVNSAIAWRAPEDVIDDWSDRFGLGSAIDPRSLEPHYEALERDLSVHSVERAVMGTNNQLFIDQAKKFGFPAAPMRRYDKGCQGSGLCITACPSGAKQGMSVTYIPWALQTGRARIFTSCRVDRIETSSKSVIARTEHGEALRLRARHAVVVAASTVQSPNILRRSGVRAKALGQHFQAHPGLALGGLFDRPITMAFGATQGAESIHFRKTERFKLETISLPPDLAAARIPGVGAELAERLAQLGHVAVWAAQVRAEAEGTVSQGWGGVDRVRYTMTENDLRAARKACALLARMMFDAGAKEVWPGVFGVPSVLRSIDEVALLDDAPLEPRSYNFIATHLFGAARMGKEPLTSVVAPTFEVHGHPGVFVVDSSVFPTNLGVNPQHTIMAMSRLASERLSERILRTASGRSRIAS